MTETLAVLLIFGGGATFLLSISPIGRAIADRIRGRGDASGGRLRFLQENHDALLEEVDGMRQDIAELQERVDFAERLLAKDRESASLPPSDDVQN